MFENVSNIFYNCDDVYQLLDPIFLLSVGTRLYLRTLTLAPWYGVCIGYIACYGIYIYIYNIYIYIYIYISESTVVLFM